MTYQYNYTKYLNEHNQFPDVLDTQAIGLKLKSKHEVFKHIEEYPNYYISNWGRVFSCHARKIEKQILKLQWQGSKKLNNQYLCARLANIEGKYCNAKIHQLVAQYFIPNPEGKKEIHHKDKNKNNNRWDNLQYVDRDEHKLLDGNIKLYLCNPFTGTKQRCKTYDILSDKLQVEKSFIHNFFKTKIPKIYEDGTKQYEVSEDYINELRYILITPITRNERNGGAA